MYTSMNMPGNQQSVLWFMTLVKCMFTRINSDSNNNTDNTVSWKYIQVTVVS